MIMEEKDTELRDEGLRGNEKIEEAIAGLQQEPTQEMLAHALTVVRRRMKENGQLIVMQSVIVFVVCIGIERLRLCVFDRIGKSCGRSAANRGKVVFGGKKRA